MQIQKGLGIVLSILVAAEMKSKGPILPQKFLPTVSDRVVGSEVLEAFDTRGIGPFREITQALGQQSFHPAVETPARMSRAFKLLIGSIDRLQTLGPQYGVSGKSLI